MRRRRERRAGAEEALLAAGVDLEAEAGAEAKGEADEAPVTGVSVVAAGSLAVTAVAAAPAAPVRPVCLAALVGAPSVLVLAGTLALLPLVRVRALVAPAGPVDASDGPFKLWRCAVVLVLVAAVLVLGLPPSATTSPPAGAGQSAGPCSSMRSTCDAAPAVLSLELDRRRLPVLALRLTLRLLVVTRRSTKQSSSSVGVTTFRRPSSGIVGEALLRTPVLPTSVLWPESRFQPSSDGGAGERSAGCCSVGGATTGRDRRGGATTTGPPCIDVAAVPATETVDTEAAYEFDEQVELEGERCSVLYLEAADAPRGAMWTGGSAATVLS